MRFFTKDSASQHPGESLYLHRWIFNFFFFSIRVHHWVGSDDQRFEHDHAWPFLSIVLKGQLSEKTGNITKFWYAGSIRFCGAKHRHIVSADDCWTLLITGPEIRKWGFHTSKGFLKKKDYFKEFGHH